MKKSQMGTLLKKAMLLGAKVSSNTACYLFYYQPKEPHDFKARLDKIDRHNI